jgi:hypothetical protein
MENICLRSRAEIVAHYLVFRSFGYRDTIKSKANKEVKSSALFSFPCDKLNIYT